MIKPPSLGVLDESRESDGNVIISESKLRALLPTQVKIMPNQRRDLCGCKSCILETSLQVFLNVQRSRHIICLEKMSESRVLTRSYGVFKENLNTYI